jgi:GNAT superfamily N-acetyltransferase
LRRHAADQEAVAIVRLGFVHACEQNHASLSTVGGGSIVQLGSGKVVTSAIDPFTAYNWAFGIRRAFDLAGAVAAFRLAQRDYVHVRCSPSSRPDLGEELAGFGFAPGWTEAYRRSTGTGMGAPGLLGLQRADLDRFVDLFRSAWGDRHDLAGREEAFRQRFTNARSRPYRTADGNGVLVLFDAGPTTQLFHLAVAAGAQGRGLGRRVLELARGLVPAGRPVWLSTDAGGRADRAAAAAGWQASHTTASWVLHLDEPAGEP